MSHGLVVALKGEARAILGRGRWEEASVGSSRPFPLRRTVLDGGGEGELLSTLCGVGRDNARAGAEFLADKGVLSLINIGLAGGLSPAVKAGEIILASSIISDGEPVYERASKALEFACGALGEKGLKSRQGVIVSTESAILDAEAKGVLYEKTGALAVDMESAGMAAVAAKNALPLFVMRVVCDEAHKGISRDLYECLGVNGGVRPARIIAGSVRRPSMVSEMMALRRSYALALSVMSRAWQVLLQAGFLTHLSS